VSADTGAEQNPAIFERSLIEVAARGVSGTEETILGSAFVGSGPLQDGENGNRGDYQGIYREPREGTE
jgi:hypothetical protein